MSHFNFCRELLLNPFTKECLLLVEAIVVAGIHPINFVHDRSNPPPCPHSLDAVPKLVLDGFTSVGHTKWTLLGDGGRGNSSFPFIDCHCFMPNRPH